MLVVVLKTKRFWMRVSIIRLWRRARGALETREYWHSEDVKVLSQRKQWAGLKSVAMVRNTVVKDGQTRCSVVILLVVCLWGWLMLCVRLGVIGWWRVCIGIWM